MNSEEKESDEFKDRPTSNKSDDSTKSNSLFSAENLRKNRDVKDINIIDLIRIIWLNKRIVLQFFIFGAFFGVLIAILSPVEFISSSRLMPELRNENVGGNASQLLQRYGGLIGLSGNSYSSASNAISVELYPEIVNSLSFQSKLIEYEFYFLEYDTTVSLETFFEEIKPPSIISILIRYTIGIPYQIKEWIFPPEGAVQSNALATEPDMLLTLTRDQMELIEKVRERVYVSLNDENGIITITAKMPDRYAAAQITQFTINELTEYLVDYRIQKVKRDLEFIEEQLESAKVRFQRVQLELADFKDSNQGVLTAKSETELQRLNSEYDLSFNLYNSLTQQYEEAKLKVQENTPVFKVLQPVFIPVEKSEPRRTVIVLFTSFLFLGIGIVFPFIKMVIKKYKTFEE